ncbi:response regulator [Pseudochryseolinea flava]|uniref:DNA-binding response regulator n=1 Tax=Pseudochryseolinea flava TaxID=2059302 RepID=A0A364Y4M6_9BACT|nr:response regulator transcription factor [Pseudochryseolinea flava]RAW01001.1 DNA-binding response regulator [Pseudochryseolinea flava]
MPTKIFITDDHVMVTEGIRLLFERDADIEWMGSADNAASCLTMMQEQQPDIMLLDISLPDKSGIDLCRELKALYPTMRIIALSSFNQLSFIQKMIQNGAQGYVLKNASHDELRYAIKSVMNDEVFMSADVKTILREEEADKIPVLTKREKEVLNLIADGMTNQNIADKLFISPATVDTHRKNLITKFEVKNTASLIRHAAHYGFL